MAPNPPHPKNEAYLRKAHISIPSISCANCVVSINNKLNDLNTKTHGLREYHVDATTKLLEITYDTQTTCLEDILYLLNTLKKPGNVLEDLPLNISHTATLHFSTRNQKLKNEGKIISTIPTVLQAITSPDLKYLRVFYDPKTIGARSLKNQIINKAPALSHSSKIGLFFDEIGDQKHLSTLKTNLIISTPISIIIFIFMMILPVNTVPFLEEKVIPGVSWKYFISLILSTPIQFWVGLPIHLDAFYALKNRTTNMSVLISLATNICYFYSLIVLFSNFILSFSGQDSGIMVFFETSAVLITFILIGRYIEAKVKDKTHTEINKLHTLQPDYVMILGEDQNCTQPPNSSISDLRTVVSDSQSSNMTHHTKEMNSFSHSHPDHITPLPHKHEDFIYDVSKNSINHSECDKNVQCNVKASQRNRDVQNGDLNVLRSQTSFSNGSYTSETQKETEINVLEMISAEKIMNPIDVIPQYMLQNIKKYDLELLEIGDMVEIKEGMMIPSDGVIIYSSHVEIDESMLTGESTPMLKSSGDNLIGGTICISGYMIMRVRHIGSSTILGQMMDILRSSGSEMSFEKIADKISKIFVPAVIILASLTWIIWAVLVSTSVVEPSDDHHMGMEINDVVFVLEFGIAVLAIACPCAIGLASPTATAVGAGLAAKNSILVKKTHFFEIINKVNAIIFDKTGTLTYGLPSITNVFFFGDNIIKLRTKLSILYKKISEIEETSVIGHEMDFIDCVDVDQKNEFYHVFWVLLNSLEQKSGHHIAKAISSHTQDNLGIRCNFPVNGFSLNEHTRSISGEIEQINVRIDSIGSFDFSAHFSGSKYERIMDRINEQQSLGHSLFIVQFDNYIIGIVNLRDDLRSEAKKAIQYLQKKNIDVYICSGDHKNTVQAIASSLGIDQAKIFSQQSPIDKAVLVESLAQKKIVAMAGDGINDSLALSKASIGIAIGEISNITSSAADAIIVKPNLINLIFFIELSKHILHTIHRNYVWASIFNIVCIPTAAGILYPVGFVLPPAISGAVMALSSISVVISSLLAKRFKLKNI